MNIEEISEAVECQEVVHYQDVFYRVVSVINGRVRIQHEFGSMQTINITSINEADFFKSSDNEEYGDTYYKNNNS